MAKRSPKTSGQSANKLGQGPSNSPDAIKEAFKNSTYLAQLKRSEFETYTLTVLPQNRSELTANKGFLETDAINQFCNTLLAYLKRSGNYRPYFLGLEEEEKKPDWAKSSIGIGRFPRNDKTLDDSVEIFARQGSDGKIGLSSSYAPLVERLIAFVKDPATATPVGVKSIKYENLTEEHKFD